MDIEKLERAKRDKADDLAKLYNKMQYVPKEIDQIRSNYLNTQRLSEVLCDRKEN